MVYKHSGLLFSHKKEWDIAICKNRDGPREYHGVTKGRTWLSDFTFTFHFHALEKDMATHSSVLAWRIPGMGEPGGLPSLVSHRVSHDWSDLAAAAAAATRTVAAGEFLKSPFRKSCIFLLKGRKDNPTKLLLLHGKFIEFCFLLNLHFGGGRTQNR